jgi:predicted transcriptional regulator
MSKDKNNKSRCTKNKYQLTAQEVAGIAGCSVSYVKKLRAGIVNMESDLAKKVLSVDTIAESGKSLLIKEIERLVKLPA